MSILQAFLFGYAAAFVGTLPPGLLNMTVIKISYRDNKNRALWFAFGASTVILFQTFIAVVFGRYISKRADISDAIHEIGILIFLGLTIYFFWSNRQKKKQKKGKEEVKVRTKSSRFMIGALLSALNLFPIPYYAVVSLSLATLGWFSFENSFLVSFSIGTALAAFSVFVLYVWGFPTKKSEDSYLLQNFNKVLGIITGIITVFGLIKLVF
jgi:threonine/homoserine/homoserine lactone efflux protein